ncbi:DUF6246 family protein [Pectobacterium sp. CHL-2024]|uniref:DUF6246 family protein n=1 Tax=Pectobacterium sp. CHL-2024 TaxID=3377079 RepID=UPI00380AF964
MWNPGRCGIAYRSGGMLIGEIVLIAHTLIGHGMMGKGKVRKLQLYETNSYVKVEYINAARIHFGISQDEAERLTMT